jgi:KUP system potassium uptake protein
MPTADTSSKKKQLPLMVGALGVVFGDIGTSPLYALKSSIFLAGVSGEQNEIMGLISLFIWALILIVSVKYMSLVMRLDKNGEGGILILSSLVSDLCKPKHKKLVMTAGILGVSFFVGDGIITPAISILSAVEGIVIVKPELAEYVSGITIFLLILLFYIQKFGSGKIGVFFGPIMIIWFCTLFLMGAYQIFLHPFILKSLNPYYAVFFIINHLPNAIAIMGGVILVVTGAEALYADIGHFSRPVINKSWFFLVFPALVVNYLGQGALVISSATTVLNPFYSMAPEKGLKYLIALATVATIIASQAVISGLFSIVWQSIVLNYLPRMRVVNTSSAQRGQVYVPVFNGILLMLTVGSVLLFSTSEKLSVAYGFCVSLIMLITTALVSIFALNKWRWSKITTALVFSPILVIEFLFVSTGFIKILEGAWYVLSITLIFCYLIYTWLRGSKALTKQKVVAKLSVESFVAKYSSYARIPGASLFLCRDPFQVPRALIMNLKHNKYLHEKLIFVSISISHSACEKSAGRYKVTRICDSVFQVTATFGFREIPDLSRIINMLKEHDVVSSSENVSIFLSKGIPVASGSKVLSGFSEKLYILMSSLAQNATDFYKIPHEKVIELGVRYKV